MMNVKKWCNNWCILFFFIPIFLSVPAGAETTEIVMPGAYNHMVKYIASPYSMVGEDVLFHLNEIFLMEYIPTYETMQSYLGFRSSSIPKLQRRHRIILRELKRATKMTFTVRFRHMLEKYRELKSFLKEKYGDSRQEVDLDLNSEADMKACYHLLLKMGLKIMMDDQGALTVVENVQAPNYDVNRLYQVMGIEGWRMGRVLSRTAKFQMKVEESRTPLPMDLTFFKEVTGLPLTEENFLETLANDSKLSRLLGIFYRLSDNEISYISRLETGLGAWKQIYADDMFLSGFFVLSHGLRVNANGLMLPGGQERIEFWNQLAGAHPVKQPVQFLRQVATKDKGKLNYFYVFGFFLPNIKQEAAFCYFDLNHFSKWYDLLNLEKSEQLQAGKNPELEDFSFFTYLYALQVKNRDIYFPNGVKAWAEAIGAETHTFEGLTTKLLQDGFKSFIPVYSKFFEREELMTPRIIRLMIENYSQYNVLVDYLEKLPVKKPETVLNMFTWVKKFSDIPGSREDRDNALAVMQSLLVFLSQGAKYHMEERDYDALLQQVMQIPLHGAGLYDGLCRFLEESCYVNTAPDEADASFLHFVTGQIKNVVVEMGGQDYTLHASERLKAEITRIMSKQEVFKFSGLMKINKFLKEFEREGLTPQVYKAIIDDIKKALQLLPRGEWKGRRLSKQADRLLDSKGQRGDASRVSKIIAEMKSDGLLSELKHLMVTSVYGLATTSSRLRLFVNPNIVRMHDFSPSGKKTAWNCSEISLKAKDKDNETYYHIEGGLSRMEITMAIPFGEHLFRRRLGYDSAQVASMVYNNFSIYPYSTGLEDAQQQVGEGIRLGEKMMTDAGNNPAVKEKVKDAWAHLTSGYQYRKLMEKLEGRNPDYQPYYRQLLTLGEFFQNYDPSADNANAETKRLDPLGPLCYHTFGRLSPFRFNLFPQALSQLFKNGYSNGEMIDELKIKAAFINDQQKMPAGTLGQVVYRYLFSSARYFTNYYENDYYKTYFIYNTYNYLYMNQLYKEMKRKGILRIR